VNDYTLWVRESAPGLFEAVDAEHAKQMRLWLENLLDCNPILGTKLTQNLRALIFVNHPYLHDWFEELPPIDRAMIFAELPAVPLEYIGYWKNERFSIRPDQWNEAHRPYYERMFERLKLPPYHQVGDQVQLFDCIANALGADREAWYTIEAVYNKETPPEALPRAYTPDLGCVYKLQGLFQLVAHSAIARPEPSPLERLFAGRRDDIRIEYAPRPQRIIIGPDWKQAPHTVGYSFLDTNDWLEKKPLYVCLTLAQAAAYLDNEGLLKGQEVSYFEPGLLDRVSGDITSVHVYTQEHMKLGTFHYRPWSTGLTLDTTVGKL
jgi:hypothetical protein